MSETYKGIVIPEEVIIVENQSGQGYVVPAGNEKMLQTAMSWAHGYVWDYNIKDWNERKEKAVEWVGKQHKYKNGQFKISLCKAADNSWNGGKLSFWNCNITCQDGKVFLIGINQELLCNLLQACTCINGEVQEAVWLGRQKNNTGVYTEQMEDFQQAIEEKKLKERRDTSQTTKYEIGDVVGPLTNRYIYLGTWYQFYEETLERDYSRGRYDDYILTIKELKKPVLKHLFIDAFYAKGASLENEFIGPSHIYDDFFKSKKPKYVVYNHIDVDIDKFVKELYERAKEDKSVSAINLYAPTADTKLSIEELEERLTAQLTFNSLQIKRV